MTPVLGPQVNPFAVCRMGIVWRLIVGVQLAVALGAMFGSTDGVSALVRWAQASVVSLPATLVWLLLICGLSRYWVRLPEVGQFGATTSLGGVVVVLAMWPTRLLEQSLGLTASGGWSWVPPVTAGMVTAALATSWLRARARAVVPTDAQARLAELQARIRPHFLFNTLNTAIALVQIEPRRAESVLEDLAELFREALASPSAQSTLRQEMDLARRYLAIEALRFGDRMSVQWSVDESLNDVVVPALVLQPLVENAVHHGVETSSAGGWIHIEVYAQAGKAQVVVSNSVPKQVREGAWAEGQGMALLNVSQRLRLMYDLEADFDAALQSTDVKGESGQIFRAHLAVPVSGGGWT